MQILPTCMLVYGLTTLLQAADSVTPSYVVLVNALREVTQLNHFWESTGLCPPDPHQEAYTYLQSNDTRMNLAFIGAVPNSGIKQVRVHWLLDLVTINRIENSYPEYNFTLLDNFVEVLWKNGLKPGFELMGNPSNYFTDLENHTQVYEWRRLVMLLAKNFIDQYGVGYVSTWNFETWNEPDHHDFDGLKFTVQGFLNYYDACSEGLGAASSKLKFGGPGASCRKVSFSKMCWALLDHVIHGLNYFTGETGVRMDFVSFHKKGGHGSGSSKYLMDEELDTIQKMREMSEELASKPIINDEADPMVGWSKPTQWRVDVTYAAMIAKIIGEHQNLILAKPGNNIKYHLLSNDNAFLNYYPYYFEQRTLLARFQMNNTKSRYTQFIRKPAYMVMGLLSLLGNVQLQSTVEKGMHNHMDVQGDDGFGILSSIQLSGNKKRHASEIAILLYYSHDTSNVTGHCLVNVSITDIPYNFKDAMLIQYGLDNYNTNPYAVWKNLGKPTFPTLKEFELMRKHEGPVRDMLKEVDISTGILSLTITVTLPSVHLILLCSKTQETPDQVTDVQFYRITENQVLIIWSDSCVHSRCITTYEVEYSKLEEGRYNRVNKEDTIFLSHIHIADRGVQGYYRVRAVDVWNKAGPYSIPAFYGG